MRAGMGAWSWTSGRLALRRAARSKFTGWSLARAVRLFVEAIFETLASRGSLNPRSNFGRGFSRAVRVEVRIHFFTRIHQPDTTRHDFVFRFDFLRGVC